MVALPGSGRVRVAFSGGLDSTVLLHALAKAGVKDLAAIHVHHGLQALADDWVAHCEQVCAALGVALQVVRVNVEDAGQGVEAAAREARYMALRARLQPGDTLATAHHRDDQAETVLLRLMRGTGPAGLAAIRPLTEFAPGWLWRPLLDVSREQVLAHAQRHGLKWIEDPHNQSSRFSRSFLRAEILPRLRARWPAASRNLARAAELSTETAELLREMAISDLDGMVESNGALPIPRLLQFSAARRRNLVRGWIEGLGLPTPFHDTLLRLDREVLEAAEDADPVLAWPGGEFRRCRQHLFALQVLPPVPKAFEADWDGRGDFELPAGCGRLHRAADRGRPWPCTVRMARPGDRFKPVGSAKTRSLKNLFQERVVPTWVRQRTPLVARQDRILWVGGFGWADDADTGAALRKIEWLDRPGGAPPA
ncbi:tRNA lysidine(34) synthetase TilS [Panacagrimonas perspica]|uniref:tRNA lysidine(34) synthetase TilS n=1 Tax=Panacagrimonas perspica TaxID=381431 RepID=UPI001138AB2D|nr:tRNA lysidine(34) synthetase TilS [Panacagrimonas perspica]THD01514.1 tRNA lysidine(34) synthetase TilS [Panacagrimonas perspica]